MNEGSNQEFKPVEVSPFAMKHSVFLVFIFIFIAISSPSAAEKLVCGNFSDSELNNLDAMISTKGHDYRIQSKEFVDGWRKLIIFPYDNAGFEELDKFKTLVSMPIHQCLCGTLAQDSYLYTNLDK